MTTINLDTSELREGDVVRAHGLRCLIDGPIESSEYEDDPRGRVYFTHALVLNRADVSFDAVPETFTRQTTGWPEYQPTGEHRWTIQGNILKRWNVERYGKLRIQ
jgi:hypothetical protein